MIVRSVTEGWRIIYHSAHALLAQALAAELDQPRDLPHWKETRVAIAMHDDFKLPFDPGTRHYLTDAGAPLDFTLVSPDSETRVREAKRRIDEAVKKLIHFLTS